MTKEVKRSSRSDIYVVTAVDVCLYELCWVCRDFLWERWFPPPLLQTQSLLHIEVSQMLRFKVLCPSVVPHTFPSIYFEGLFPRNPKYCFIQRLFSELDAVTSVSSNWIFFSCTVHITWVQNPTDSIFYPFFLSFFSWWFRQNNSQDLKE